MGKMYQGRGDSQKSAIDDLDKLVKKTGVKLAQLGPQEYHVSVLDKDGVTLGVGKGPMYTDALNSALNSAAIPADTYKPKDYRHEVVVLRPFNEPAQTVAKGNPSGAAPMYGRKGSNITDLF